LLLAPADNISGGALNLDGRGGNVAEGPSTSKQPKLFSHEMMILIDVYLYELIKIHLLSALTGRTK
jgi:hypothetical protein